MKARREMLQSHESVVSVQENSVFKCVPFDGGFFANFNLMMSMNTNSKIVVPYWANSVFNGVRSHSRHYNYWGRTDDENVFLRYFDLLIDIKNIELLPIQINVGDNRLTIPEFRYKLMRNPATFTEIRHKYHAIYTRLFRPNKIIMRKVNDFMAGKHNTIAVHVRNPVHNIEVRPLSLKNYFDAISLVDDGKRPILLATDNELSLLVFKDKFGDRLIYFPDSQRASIDMHFEWIQALRTGREDANGLINGNGYELHNHRSAKVLQKDIAYDVVFEMLCLQQAACFIGSVSNVALVTAYMNPVLPMTIL
jgi:hypothetical protein